MHGRGSFVRLLTAASSDHCAPQEVVAKDISRDKYFTPDSAVEYGVIDRIIYPRKQRIAA